MLTEKIKDYFSFTKKERTGIIALVFLIVLIFILPYFFTTKIVKADPKVFKQFENEIAGLKKQESVPVYPKSQYQAFDNYKRGSSENRYIAEKSMPARLFYFDPNTASEEQWEQLGLKEKTIHTIQNYLSKGGGFRKPSDLEKIYGLSKNLYDRILPYARIENKNNERSLKDFKARDSPDLKNGQHEFGFHEPKKKSEPSIIDINKADSVSFMTLKGIGSKLAARILHFRERLGGFYSVDQVAEVYALPDSVFQKIRSFLMVHDPVLRQIDINTAGAEEMKQHPYIRWNLANAIIQYRKQHGDFHNVGEIRQVSLLDSLVFRKILPYILIKN